MNAQDPIMVIDDDESDASSVTLDNDPDRLYCLRDDSRTAAPFLSQPDDVVDLTDDETVHEGDYITDDILEILREDWLHAERDKSLPKSESVQKKLLEEVCDENGIVYKPGQSVEIQDDTYLRISSIWQDHSGIFLGGRRLRRLRPRPTDLEITNGAYLPQWKNELIWKDHETGDIPIEFVRRFVPIHFTNFCHYKQDPQKEKHPKDFFCRLKENFEGKTGVSVEYLTYNEADDGFRATPATLRSSWRGETTPFGDRAHSSVIVLDDIEESSSVDGSVQRKYTFGDGFCGAGGVSCGAEGAGLHVKWAFDLSSEAAISYRLNFKHAFCEESDIFNFLTNTNEFLRVDITHGSPPCQTFSPAKTRASANDEANFACIFSTADLIRKAKPRVHTMEETSGLLERHQATFFAVIHDFIEIGYSVRWGILNCVEYGVPQLRRRLVVIASGPGEKLPTIPSPTHGPPGSGLHNFSTIRQAISNIPRNALDHDVEAARTRFAQNKAPFDANQQARTITCGGGENYHPSGRRGFTNREYACLQTFPLSFQFGRNMRKQIGNAVPPVFANAIYSEIIKTLQETDCAEASETVEN